MTSYLRKTAPAPTELSGTPDIDCGEWGSSLPALAEFLVATSWSDGTVRLPGSLTLFADQGVWKICLSDKDQGQIAFVSGSSPLLAFQAAERGLVEATLDWRLSRPRNSNKRRGS